VKALVKPLHKHTGRVQLRKSDLRELTALLSSCGEVLTIFSDKFEFDSMEEFLSSEYPASNVTFSIVLQDSKVIVSVSLYNAVGHSTSVCMFASLSTPLAAGVFAQLDEFLRPRQAKVDFFSWLMPSLDPAPIRLRPEKPAPRNWRAISWDLTKIAIPLIAGALITLMVQRSHTISPSPSQPSAATAPSKPDSGTAP